MQVAHFQVTKQDPKRTAQEAAARGDWRPTDQILRKADPDYVKRFFINEAIKLDMRRLYSRAILLGQGKESRATQESRAQEFWAEYAALDPRWIGDHYELKAEAAKEQE